MKNWTIAVKMGLAFGLVLLLTCVLGYVAYTSMRQTSNEADAIAYAKMPAVTFAGAIDRNMRNTGMQARAFSFSGDEKDYAEAVASLELMRGALAQMRALGERYPSLTALSDFVRDFGNALSGYTMQLERNREAIRVQEACLGVLAKLSGEAGASAEMIAEAESTAILESGVVDMYVLGKQMAILQEAERLRSALAATRGVIYELLNARDVKRLEQAIGDTKRLHESALQLQQRVELPHIQSMLQATAGVILEFYNQMVTLKATWEQQIASDLKRVQAYTAMEELVTTFNTREIETTGQQADAISVSTSDDVQQVFVLIMAVLFIGLALSILLTRMIVGPIRQSVQYAGTIADGNLDHAFSYVSHDEVGRLADALRRMVQSLKGKIAEANEQSAMAREKEREAVDAVARAEEATRKAEAARREGMLEAARQLEGVVNVVSSASEQLAAQIEQSLRGAGHAAGRMDETATAMEQMNCSVLEVARNAATAAEVSTRTRQRADAGAGVVHEALESIRDVRVKSLALREDMHLLGQHAHNISRIMGVISDIADQTNLLALNAAIEAARAGDAGRGFAVVADEVRKLAEKTMASTTDVADAVRAIQQSATQNMAQVDATVATIENATTLADNSGAALVEIVSMVDDAAGQVRAIAAASEEQSAASEQINRSLADVNTITTESSRAMQESHAAVRELANQTQILARLVETMKQG